ncbi:CASP-like protein 5B3 [Panicum miliaceum]|uniref:CASP-like protein n=1 Tax=Panicum miliaceum TaxID=4540 RepID=A0A3L6SQ10_PANMI|nr:CASP-like protein 5B3 [Panicum miliaceum]
MRCPEPAAAHAALERGQASAAGQLGWAGVGARGPAEGGASGPATARAQQARPCASTRREQPSAPRQQAVGSQPSTWGQATALVLGTQPASRPIRSWLSPKGHEELRSILGGSDQPAVTSLRRGAGTLGEEMKDVMGSPGTLGGLALRMSQFVCAAGSLAAMFSAYGFTNYSAFCYLFLQMTLLLIWSFILVCIDIHSLKINWDLHSTGNLRKYVIGDWMLAIGSLSAASSATAVAILLATDVEFCRVNPLFSCSRYKVSAILASMAWSFIAASAGSTFWLLVSLFE